MWFTSFAKDVIGRLLWIDPQLASNEDLQVALMAWEEAWDTWRFQVEEAEPKVLYSDLGIKLEVTKLVASTFQKDSGWVIYVQISALRSSFHMHMFMFASYINKEMALFQPRNWVLPCCWENTSATPYVA